MNKIILGSASPRRQQLLKQAEITFEIRTADIDEQFDPAMPVADVPAFIAANKAQVLKESLSKDDILITADTVVVLNNKIIGKPANEQEAIETLQQLSGETHQVITAVHIIKDNKEISFSDTTLVSFNELSLSQIQHYVQNYKPYDKAGAYAIQEWIGVVGIKKIDGCFYNVMGLPVAKVLKALEKIAADA